MSPIERCLVMGIVNRTPDSFYDGGLNVELDAAIAHGLRLVEEGADVLDLGGVKAGPGPDVDEDEETHRLVPLVEALRGKTTVPISVETARPNVATRAFEAGASILNDVTGLDDPELCAVAARHDARLVLMHHGGQIRGRPLHPRYDDVVRDVLDTWNELSERAKGCGLTDDDLIVDPGLDFGKNTFHSLELMARLDELTSGPWPVLVAASRKDVVGETLGLPLEERLEGSLALVALSVLGGAAMVRVHDVKESVRVVRMVEAVMGRRPPDAPVRGLWE
jgi:dihydropteroate synthase